jgi:hypothetical protein
MIPQLVTVHYKHGSKIIALVLFSVIFYHETYQSPILSVEKS